MGKHIESVKDQFAKDGYGTEIAELLPLGGFVSYFLHNKSGHKEHAKKALPKGAITTAGAILVLGASYCCRCCPG